MAFKKADPVILIHTRCANQKGRIQLYYTKLMQWWKMKFAGNKWRKFMGRGQYSIQSAMTPTNPVNCIRATRSATSMLACWSQFAVILKFILSQKTEISTCRGTNSNDFRMFLQFLCRESLGTYVIYTCQQQSTFLQKIEGISWTIPYEQFLLFFLLSIEVERNPLKSRILLIVNVAQNSEIVKPVVLVKNLFSKL